MSERDPGVPGALARALRSLAAHVSPDRLDRLWVFPPLRNGRRENGVLAAGCFAEDDRRLLVTLAYRAEETGKGVSFEHAFHEEGEAPGDRLPRVMEGVVQRFGEAPGDPRVVPLGGDAGAFRELVEELDPETTGSPSEQVRSSGPGEEASR